MKPKLQKLIDYYKTAFKQSKFSETCTYSIELMCVN